MIKIDTRVTPELKEKIKADSAKEGRSFCAQIRWMLEQYYRIKNGGRP